MKFMNLQKRIGCILLALLILFTIVPISGFVPTAQAADIERALQGYDEDSRYNVTITVTNENRRPITGATITVSSGRDTYEVVEVGGGQYKFTKAWNNGTTYTIVVSAPGYETKTTTMSGRNSSVRVTLEEMEDLSVEKLATFKVFYIATGKLPNSYAGAGSSSDYGPSGNDTPLVLINVDINKLRQEKYSSVVVYKENTTDNTWEFTPNGAAKDMAAVEAFWDAVWECMTEESRVAFEQTGFADDFFGYVLKLQKSGNVQHCDGVLTKEPPVYVIELYDQGKYFGGSSTDASDLFKKMIDVQQMYEDHLKVDITWATNTWSKESVGTYFSNDRIYTVKITQTNANDAQKISGSEIPYQKGNSTGTYFLAKFNIVITEGAQGYHTVTYADGVNSEQIFADQVKVVEAGNKAPSFEGVPQREGYHFLGWMREGVSGYLTDADIAAMTVNSDLTFYAAWEAIPTTFTGTVNVLLNNTYATDITSLMDANTELYFSQDGSRYIQLAKTEQGVYAAELENGQWYLYISTDGESYTKVDDGALVINNAPASRDLCFYSVNYNLNGGTVATSIPVRYYLKGTHVYLTDIIPTKDLFRFVGWKAGESVYQSESILTTEINNAYTLVAQWEKTVSVTVNVTIDHRNGSGVDKNDTKDDIYLELVNKANATAPYLETGKTLSLNDSSYIGFSYNPTYGSGETADVVILSQYTANNVTFTDLPGGTVEYSVVTSKSGYDTTVTTQQDGDGNWIVDVYMEFKPENFNLQFAVEVEDAVPQDYLPSAVIVKVTFWNGENWELITQQAGGAPGVRVNIDPQTKKGVGSYPVWKVQSDDMTPYGYRVVVTAFVYPNGTIVSASETADDVQWGDNAYLATLHVGSDSAQYGSLHGAYFAEGSQHGTLDVTVSMELFDVTFNAMGGSINSGESFTVKDQYKIPVLSDFIPVRDGGYIFDGWYTMDGSISGDWGSQPVSGTDLTANVTFYAKWREPIKVTGTVYVAGSYQLDGQTHYIHGSDRTSTVLILLRKQGQRAVYRTAIVNIIYDGHLGTGTYSFEGLADDGTVYYIEEAMANYGGVYINESVNNTDTTDFTFYSVSQNTAVLGGDKIAQVNAYLPFAPDSFDLQYSVDASAIAGPFRPNTVEVFVTYDADHTIMNPENWPVISQMVFATGYRGNVIHLSAGKGTGSTSVWSSFPNGSALYDYGIRVGAVTGTMLHGYVNAPYSITYQAPAHQVSGGQSKELIAKLTPKQYSITYELGVDSTAVSGMELAPKAHTWSFATDVSRVTPTRYGYEFLGWYKNADCTGDPITTIDAAVAEDITLYAKWYQKMDDVDLTVTIIHTTANSGEASNYDKDLSVQLTSAKEGSSNYEAMFGYSKTYGKEIWHTLGDDADEETLHVSQIFKGLGSDFAYSLNVSLDGYYVESKTVTEVVDPLNGATTYHVEITLAYQPDLLNFRFQVEMAPGIDESLWPESAEVRVTCWYDHPSKDIGLDWNTITQHESSSVTVMLGSTGKGTGSYPVWQWLEKGTQVPYYYRIEVISLHLSDGSVVLTNGTDAEHDVVYSGGDYSATIKTKNCVAPDGTTLPGAYGQVMSGGYAQIGEVKAVISIDRWKDDEAQDSVSGGDGIDDHQQALIQFRTEDAEKGTIDGMLSQVITLNDIDGNYTKVVRPTTVVLRPNETAGYVFSHWTDEAGNVVNPFQDQTVSGGQTYVYTAHWKYNENLSYTVKYLEKGTNNVLHTDKIEANITFGTQVIAGNEIIGIPGYVFDYAADSSIIVGMDENVLVLYYTTDVLDDADDNLTDGDGIADYKQAVIQFVSGNNGSVSGKTLQVVTLTDVDGSGQYVGSITPEVVTITANPYYTFAQWDLPNGDSKTEENAPYLSTNKLAAEGGKTYTYSVSWKAKTYQYQVRYLEKNSDAVLAVGLTKNLTYNGTVQTEQAIDIIGYHLVSSESSTRPLAYADGQIITFYYEKNEYDLIVNFEDIDTGDSIHVAVVVEDLPYKAVPSTDVLQNLASIPGYSFVEAYPSSVTILDPSEQGNKQNQITLKYRKNKYTLTVLYYYDGVLDNSKTDTIQNISYGTQISTVWTHSGAANKSNTNYVLDKITNGNAVISDNAALNVVHVYYLRDTLVDNTKNTIVRDPDGVGDGIPDTYQATVTYEVVNGSWVDQTDKVLTYVFTLYQKLNDGTWSQLSNVELDDTLPTGSPASGFTGNGIWYPSEPTGTTKVVDDAEYTLVYMDADTHVITVKVVNGSVTVDGAAKVEKTFTLTVRDQKYTASDVDETILTFIPDAQHILYKVIVDGVAVASPTLSDGKYVYTIAHDQDHTITVDFEIDAIGEDTDRDGNWDEPDGIPDKYQKRINYQIINGTWYGTDNTNKHIFVTLKTDDKYDVHGTAQLTDPYPTTKKPMAGYVIGSGAWINDVADSVSFPVTVSGLQEETFIYSYNEKQKVTIVIEVDGGTSYPKPSTTVYEYSTNETTIEFAGNENHILTSAVVDGSEITLVDGKYYTHNYTHSLHIKVVYKLDRWKDNPHTGNDSVTGGDNTPDEEQALVQFTAAVNGSITGAITQIFTFNDDGSGTYKGKVDLDNVAVDPDNGYKLLYWLDTAGNTYTNDQLFAVQKELEGGKSYSYTAIFAKDVFDYRVEYYFDGVRDDAKTEIFTGVIYETKISLNPANRTGSQSQYLLEEVTPAVLIVSHVSANNVIKVFYVTDQLDDANDKETGGDGIPDYQQALIRFMTGGNGSVNGVTVQVFTLTNNRDSYSSFVVPAAVKTIPDTGYKFSHWTRDGEEMNPYQPTNLSGGMQICYTAQFVKDSFNYRVEYYYDGVLTTTVPGPKTEYASYVTVDPSERDGNYMLESVDPATKSLQIGAIEEENVIRVYYVKDQWKDTLQGADSDSEGDGIADYQQVLVTFASVDMNGTVTGTGITQVFTFGSGVAYENVTPVLDNVIVDGIAGYSFDYWTRDNLLQLVNPGDTLVNVPAGSSIIFYAHFAEDVWKDSEVTTNEDVDSLTGGDNIPDKYQAVITYMVENGTWSDGTDNQRNEVFTLYSWDATGCRWTKRHVSLGNTVPQNMHPDAGYVTTGYWGDADIAVDDPTAATLVTTNATYTYYYGERMKFNITVTVENGVVTPDQTAIQVIYGEDQSLIFQPDAGYALDYVMVDGVEATLTDGGYTFTDVKADHTIHVVYSVDNWKDSQQTVEDDADSIVGGDGIPDNRQAIVSFAAGRNGTVHGTVLFVITLSENNGAYVGQFNTDKDEVFAKADEGYKFVQWTLTKNALARVAPINAADPYAPLEIIGGYQYLYTAQFEEDMRNVTYPEADEECSGVTDTQIVQVQFNKFIRVDPNGGLWNGSELVCDIQISDANKSLYDPMLNPTKAGYVFAGWKCTSCSTDSNVIYVFTAQWLADEKGQTDADGNDIPDGIPDKYQKKVTLKVENGYWMDDTNEDIVLWLTLVDADGNWDVDGSAVLEIPTDMYGVAGYTRGAWDSVPSTVVYGIEEETYTYRFVQDPIIEDSPSTGDSFADSLQFYVFMMLLSAIALIGLVCFREEKRKMR